MMEHPLKKIPKAVADAEDGSLRLFAGQDGYQGTAAHAIWEGTV